jgi:Protein kinase domain
VLWVTPTWYVMVSMHRQTTLAPFPALFEHVPLPYSYVCVILHLQVELKEVFEDRAFYYIVMELCVGGELMDRIVDHQHFTEKVASSYFRQMLLGVQHCHTHMVVHRWVRNGRSCRVTRRNRLSGVCSQ